MDTSDYLIMVMRMIRTSERPSNAESQNVGLFSLMGSRGSVVTDKPLVSADQLMFCHCEGLTAGIDKQFQGGYVPDCSSYQGGCLRTLAEKDREGGNDRRDEVWIVYLDNSASTRGWVGHTISAATIVRPSWSNLGHGSGRVSLSASIQSRLITFGG